MQFSSGVFLLLFLPITMLLYKIGGNNREYKNLVLLIASIFFYSWGEPLFIAVVLAGVCMNYLFGIWLEKRNGNKTILVLSVIFNLGILFIFKYLTFVLGNLALFMDVKVLKIVLPIGISFYTFQIMSYIFDVYYGNVKAQKNILHLALYIMMFPQLVAGPIVRYNTVEYEIRERIETKEMFSEGISRFIVGLSKKVMIADYLGGIADKVFVSAECENITMVTAWIGALAFTLEIYYDFSGYSDMAIGLGKCFGFHFEENFNYPYMAKSISEFWRRWHISLTKWFTDYVYIPLGGNRVSNKRHILNLFIVWLLTGIWHGAEWTFILWGLLYFVIQLIEKKTEFPKKLPAIIGYIYTMFVVVICWVIFKAKDMGAAVQYLGYMFNPRNTFIDSVGVRYVKSAFVVCVVAYIGSFPVFPLIKEKMEEYECTRVIYACVEMVASVVLLVFSMCVIINGSYSPFIYFNF